MWSLAAVRSMNWDRVEVGELQSGSGALGWRPLQRSKIKDGSRVRELAVGGGVQGID